MLDQFQPEERKAIIVIFALLMLGLVYFFTHEVSWNQQQPLPNDTEGIYQEPPKDQKPYSYERYL